MCRLIIYSQTSTGYQESVTLTFQPDTRPGESVVLAIHGHKDTGVHSYQVVQQKDYEVEQANKDIEQPTETVDSCIILR